MLFLLFYKLILITEIVISTRAFLRKNSSRNLACLALVQLYFLPHVILQLDQRVVRVSTWIDFSIERPLIIPEFTSIYSRYHCIILRCLFLVSTHISLNLLLAVRFFLSSSIIRTNKVILLIFSLFLLLFMMTFSCWYVKAFSSKFRSIIRIVLGIRFGSGIGNRLLDLILFIMICFLGTFILFHFWYRAFNSLYAIHLVFLVLIFLLLWLMSVC